MVLETLALLSGVKELFMYNRQSYSFDKTLDQERLYHLQKMRVDQIKLYRDDIRDLFGLVVGKMNNYYLINTLTLGFSLGFYYDGKVPASTPSWLYWLWAMSLGSTIVFLFLSVWFAVHASVVAQMFSTRLLTQWLRLPIPGPEQIDAGAPKLEEFEKVPAGQQFRIPVVSSSSSLQRAVPDPATTNDALIQEGYNYYMGHFYMFARLQKHWMSLDAYCRVCMVLGCNQVLNVVVYTGLAWFALLDSQWGSVSFVLIPIVFSVIHAQVNLLLSRKEAVVVFGFQCLGPILASTAAGVQMVYTNQGLNQWGSELAQIIALGCYVCHFFTTCFFVYLGGLDLHNGLPTRFSTVNYIDVLGLHREDGEEDRSSDLKKGGGFSAKLTGILSSAGLSLQSNGSVADKEQPPMKEVVPPAGSLVRAESMYQSLVEKKRAEEEAIPHRDARKSVRLANSFLTDGGKGRPKLKRLKSFIGPKDYAPTPAQLHSHDMLAKTPCIAFKLVGFTMIALWLAGIVFGSISVSKFTDIAWTNILANKVSTNTTHRRLAETGTLYFPPVAKFFNASSITCTDNGGFRISDSRSDRVYLQIPDGKTHTCNHNPQLCITHEQTGSQFLPFIKISPRIFSLQVSEIANLTVTVPLVFTNQFANPVGFLSAQSLGLIIGLGDYLVVSWDSKSGAYVHSVLSPCMDSGQTDQRRIFGSCFGSEGRLLVAFSKGDSCSLQI